MDDHAGAGRSMLDEMIRLLAAVEAVEETKPTLLVAQADEAQVRAQLAEMGLLHLVRVVVTRVVAGGELYLVDPAAFDLGPLLGAPA